MTQEEKARAYDKAIERAKAMIKVAANQDEARGFANTIFPELSESEDEKIMKEIAEFIYNTAFKPKDIKKKEKWLAWLEKQGEQKHIDKIEPKFKVGDWIINPRTGLIKHIKNVLLCDNNGNYEFESSSMSIDSVDNSFRLWTIQDAKDGDVLATKNTVFIFKHIDKTGLSLCKSYCEVIGNSELGLGFDFSTNSIYPATEEQRSLLFCKMKDAGYTFDFEKKELKKIVAPIFHIGDRVRYKGHACDGVITEITETDYICGDAKLPISTQDKLELVEQDSAWSEEDERNSSYICAALDCYYRLREERSNTNGQEGLDKARNWLHNKIKSLRPQNRWKPSDEQMMALLYHCSNGSVLSSLYNDLKKLKEE